MTHTDALVIGGGQAGLAAAHTLRTAGLAPILLEAGEQPVGSWPRYYDSLELFSPARYSCLPGMAFPGDPDHYPRRDEVVDYLRRYAQNLDVDIRSHQRVTSVSHDGTYTAHTNTGDTFTAPILIAATGAFTQPHKPDLPGLDTFTGTVLHSADYREPTPFAGQRIVIVGAANSAVQIGHELAQHATVTLATRHPVKFAPQRILGRDAHFWSKITGFDHLPIGHRLRTPPRQAVNDPGHYKTAIKAGQPDQRRMFTHLHHDDITWPDGTREHLDTLILATGYRPDLGYLTNLNALTPGGQPRHDRGLSTTHPGLGYLGLEWQRSFASATLRGVGRDAHHLTKRLLTTTRRSVQDQPRTIG